MQKFPANSGGSDPLVTEAAPAQSQKQDGQILTVGSQLAVAFDDLHLPAVYQPSATGRHPGLADGLGNLSASLD